MVNHEPSPAMMEIDFCTGLHRPVGTHQTHDLQKTRFHVPTVHQFSAGKKLGVKTRNTFLEGRRSYEGIHSTTLNFQKTLRESDDFEVRLGH